MPTPPLTRFVIPCYNHGRFVADAVRSCLKQLDARVEVVIVNDGSTDELTKAACDKCSELSDNVHVIHQQNRGLPAARNVGVQFQTGTQLQPDYLAFLDADDWIEPTFISKLAAQLEHSPETVSHAYCQERLVDKATGIWTVPSWDPLLLLVTNIHPVTALVKATHFHQVGGFDESLIHGYEDWDFWLRFSKRGWLGRRVREPLFNWRRHSDVTMVMEAVKRHASLFASLMERHKDLYDQHASDVILFSNRLLRNADANWLDENLDAIWIRDLRSRNCELFDELAVAKSQIVQLNDAIAAYERKPSVRLSRALFAKLDKLPAFLRQPLRSVVRATSHIAGAR